MSELCPVCKSPITNTALGQVCSNNKCGWADGIDFGPRKITKKNNRMKIFTITAIHNDSDHPTYDHQRCFGYYATYALAKDSVDCNRGAIDEAGFYNLLVIEEIPEGIHQKAGQLAWFEWRQDHWAEIPPSIWPKATSNWALG